MLVNGRIETDIFAKDVPTVSPPQQLSSTPCVHQYSKTSRLWLNVNCSLDSFLEKRKTEYSRYLYTYASMYPPKMVKRVLDVATGLKRNENGELVRGEAREQLINSQRKDKKKPGKKVFPFVTGWHPRMPNLRRTKGFIS